MKKMFALLLLLTLSACASSPTSLVQYYSLSLNSDKSVIAISQQQSDKSLVIIDDIGLASFLAQSGLVMQINSHQIVTANYHLWAEPLDQAIAKVLKQKLNAKSHRYQFASSQRLWQQNVAFNIRVDFDKFHATDESTVIAAGLYSIYQPDKTPQIAQPFLLSTTLDQDGYLHSVQKLELLLEIVSEQILATINQH